MRFCVLIVLHAMLSSLSFKSIHLRIASTAQTHLTSIQLYCWIGKRFSIFVVVLNDFHSKPHTFLFWSKFFWWPIFRSMAFNVHAHFIGWHFVVAITIGNQTTPTRKCSLSLWLFMRKLCVWFLNDGSREKAIEMNEKKTAMRSAYENSLKRCDYFSKERSMNRIFPFGCCSFFSLVFTNILRTRNENKWTWNAGAF